MQRARDNGPFTDDESAHYREMLSATRQRVHLVKHLIMYYIALDEATPTLPAMMRVEGEEPARKTPFQRTLLHVLEQLSLHGYRRVGDHCFEEETIDIDGQTVYTHAYREVESIMSFVQRVCNKDEFPTQWDDLMANRTGIGDDIVKQLQRGVDAEFPELVANRYVFSFRNGLYCADQHVFYPWNSRARWADVARAENARRAAEDEESECPFPRPAEAPTRATVALKYFATDFPESEMSSGVNIAMPETDRILDTQRLHADTVYWTYAFLGRLLYPVKAADDWQRILFLKGVAGSGKSTFCNAVRNLFPPHVVGQIGHEDKFMLQAIYDKLLFICPEVRRDSPAFFTTQQGDFQSMVSGEGVSVAAKFKEAKTVEWRSQGLLCGNQMPGVSDAAGSINRRLMMILFDHPIPGKDLDPQLERKISANAGRLLLKMNVCFHDAARRHGRRDSWRTGFCHSRCTTFCASAATSSTARRASLTSAPTTTLSWPRTWGFAARRCT